MVSIAHLCCAAALLTAGASARPGGDYENAEYGFKLKAPRDWSQMPVQSEERWRVAVWQSDKTYFWTDKGEGWTWEHKPDFTVIAFVKSQTTGEEEEAEEEEEEDEEGKAGKDGKGPAFRFNPYKDYLEYLKGTYSGGGFYVAEERDLEVSGVPVHVYEIKVEKGAYTGPKRIVTWVYQQPDLELALQFEVLEDAHSKLKSTLEGSLRSLRLMPRSGGPMSAGTPKTILIEDLSELPPKEREEKLKILEKNAHDKALASIPPEWTSFRTKRFLVITHTDEKYARRVAEQGEGVFAWMESTFPFIGSESYVRQPVLRICANWDEYRSFWKGGMIFWFGSAPSEVISYNDQQGFATGWAVEVANYWFLDLWLQERDRDLWFALPSWLRDGLRQLIGTGRVDKNSKKMEFRVDDWERDGVREVVRSGAAVRPRDMMKMVFEEYSGGEGATWSERAKQAGSFVRYLVAGAGAKDPRCKDLLRDYLKNLNQVLIDLEAENEKQGESEPKPKTEAEEEAYFRARSQRIKQRQQEILDSVFERTFRSWDEKRWDDLEQAYFKAVGGK